MSYRLLFNSFGGGISVRLGKHVNLHCGLLSSNQLPKCKHESILPHFAFDRNHKHRSFSPWNARCHEVQLKDRSCNRGFSSSWLQFLGLIHLKRFPLLRALRSWLRNWQRIPVSGSFGGRLESFEWKEGSCVGVGGFGPRNWSFHFWNCGCLDL